MASEVRTTKDKMKPTYAPMIQPKKELFGSSKLEMAAIERSAIKPVIRSKTTDDAPRVRLLLTCRTAYTRYTSPPKLVGKNRLKKLLIQ